MKRSLSDSNQSIDAESECISAEAQSIIAEGPLNKQSGLSQQVSRSSSVRRTSQLRSFCGTKIYNNRIVSNPCPNLEVSFEELLCHETKLKSVLMTSFGIELDWLLPQFSRDCPITLVDHWNSVGVKKPVIKVPKNVSYIFPEFPCGRSYAFGSMHAKLLVLEFDKILRVVISSANLTRFDWEDICQVVWVQDFEKSVEYRQSDFGDSLHNFIKALLATSSNDIRQLTNDLFHKFDFNTAKAKLVCSLPGEWPINAGYGHLRMRDILAKQSLRGRVSFAVSSIGSVSTRWITEISESFGAETTKKLRVHWPCLHSVAKYAQRGILHYSGRHWSELKDICTPYTPASFREGLVNHSKLMIGQNNKQAWMYAGSHNFSQAAWGCLSKDRQTIKISSYEIGVLLFDVNPSSIDLPFLPMQLNWASDHLPWSSAILKSIAFMKELETATDHFIESKLIDSTSFFGDFLSKNAEKFTAVILCTDDFEPIITYILQSLLLPLKLTPFIVTCDKTDTVTHLKCLEWLLLPNKFPCLVIGKVSHNEFRPVVQIEGETDLFNLQAVDIEDIIERTR